MRGLCLVALAAVVVGAAGCGGIGTSGAAEVAGNQLTIYSSLPLQGPWASVSEQIVNGERLALADVGGRVGPFTVSYVSLDDANPSTGQTDPAATASNAKMAAQDTSTIAYLGDYDSAATAVSLPLINAAGILQVSPASPYVGLVSSQDAGQDEPQRFYPTGRRTFGRLAPGDTTEAAAQLQLMKNLGVRRLYVLNDQNPFVVPLAEIVAGDAMRAGIAVAGNEAVDTAHGTSFTATTAKVSESAAGAVFFAGGATAGAVDLWRQLHAADPQLVLLGSNALATEAFTGAIGTAAVSTYLTTPVLGLAHYPPSSAAVLADYRRQFAGEPTPYALLGYETMSVVLDAIRASRSHGNDRQTVIDRFFATHDRESVIGRYSIEPDGETTLAHYGVDRVVGGRPVFYRAIAVG